MPSSFAPLGGYARRHPPAKCLAIAAQTLSATVVSVRRTNEERESVVRGRLDWYNRAKSGACDVSMRIDPIELSRELISFNTINPPGNELRCILHLERILSGAGLETSLQEFAPGRANLIARVGAVGSKLPLCFTGHVDTVPLETPPGASMRLRARSLTARCTAAARAT